jgi:TniQ
MEGQELWDDLHRWDELRVERDRRLYEQEQEKRRHLQKVLPLPQRAAPRSWEDLASVLSRTASKMGYDHPKWLLHQENIPYTIDSVTLSVLHRRTDYLFLGRQMLLEEEQLYALTLHRFASRLYLSQYSPSPFAPYQDDLHFIDRPRLWHEDQHRFFLSEIYTRVCPLCLDEGDGSGGYDRLFWRCRLMLVCTRHHVFLVNRCPACKASIPALRPNLLICPSCGKGDYRSAMLTLTAKDAWLLTSHYLLLSHLGVGSIEAGTQLEDSNPSPLRHLASWDFFGLLRGFSRIFDVPRGRVHPLLLRSLPLNELVTLVAKQWGVHVEMLAPTIFSLYLLVAWPAHFLAFLGLLPRVLQEEYHYAAQSILAGNWAAGMVQGNYWCKGVYHSNTVSLMRPFFDTYKEYFHGLLKAEVVQERQGGRIVNEQVVLLRDLQPVTAEHVVAPYPWESLSSVLTRVARKMGYRRPEWILRPSREEPRAPSFPADITLLEPGDASRWLGQRLRVLLCPRHRLFLIDRCPVCHQLIPLFRRPKGTVCPYCLEGDYRAARRVPSFANTLLSQGQALLLHFLGIDDLNRGEISSLLRGSPMTQLEHWQYFHRKELGGEADHSLFCRFRCMATIPACSSRESDFRHAITAKP